MLKRVDKLIQSVIEGYAEDKDARLMANIMHETIIAGCGHW